MDAIWRIDRRPTPLEIGNENYVIFNEVKFHDVRSKANNSIPNSNSKLLS